MQLKNLGEIVTAIRDIEKSADAYTAAKNAISGLSKESAIAIVTSSNLTKVEMVRLLNLKELTEEEIKQALATATVSTANVGATGTAAGFSLAMKGLAVSIKNAVVALGKFLLTNPGGWAILAVGAITGLVFAYDSLTVSVEEAQEKLKEQREQYEEIASELEGIESELKNVSSRMDELNGKGTLTLTEKDELKRLRSENEELERKKRILEETLRLQGKETEEAAIETLNTTVTSKYVTDTTYDGTTGAASYQAAEVTRMEELTAATEKYNSLLEEREKIESEMDINAQKMKNLDMNSKEYKTLANANTKLKTKYDDLSLSMEETRTHANELATDLNTESESLIGATEAGAELKQQIDNLLLSYDEWLDLINNTPSEQLLNKFVSNNNLETPLKALINSGKTTDEIYQALISRFPELFAFMNEYGITVDELIQKYKNLDVVTEEALEPREITVTGTIKQIAAQVEPQFAKLGELYESIFYTDNGFDANAIDNPMLEDLRDTFLEIKEDLGITFDAEALEDFNKALADGIATEEEAHDAINALATSWFYSTDTLQNLNETTAASIQQQLEKLGVINAEEVVNAELEKQKLNLATAEEFLTKTGKDLASATSEEVQAFIWSGEAADETADHYINLAIQKHLAENPLNTAADVQNLALLCSALGVTGELYYKVLDLKMAFNAIEAGAPEQAYAGTISRLQTEIQDLLNGENRVEVDFGVPDTSGASSAGSDAADAYVEGFEKELDILDKLKDRGAITEKQYLDQLRKLYEKYFKDRKDYLDEYEQYEHQYLSGLRDLYNSVFSTIISKYDDQIDAANESKDAAINALEEQRDAAIEAIEAERDAKLKAIDDQIDSIESQISVREKEIEAIQEANEAKQREIDLEKKKYELVRLQNQRTNLVYHSDKGFIWEADQASIRDQKQAVEDAETEIRIASIKKEINVLEERRDALEDQREAIEEYYTALLEQTEKNFEQMIKQTEAYWDSVIAGMEDYKSRYEELAEMESDAKAMADLEELCASLGITVDQVLGMSDEAFQAFRDGYTGVLADIYSGNEQMLGSFEKLSGVDMGSLNGHLAETQEYINQMKNLDLTDLGTALSSIGDVFYSMAESAGGVTSSLIGGGSEGSGEGESQSSGGEEGSSGSSNNLKGAIEEVGATADTVFGTGEDDLGLIDQSKKLKENIEGTSTAIGGNGEDSEGGLVTGFETLGEVAGEQFGESGGEGLIGKAERFEEPFGQTLSDVAETEALLDGINGKIYEAELRINVSGGGGVLHTSGRAVDMFYATGSALTGNAHAEGTANASGNWAVHKGGKSLVGELGPELIVRQGKFFTVGDNGAEMVDIKPGDIIFNHKQTEEILKYGRINGRGQAFSNGSASGFAYADGTPTRTVLSASNPDLFNHYKVASTLFKIEDHTYAMSNTMKSLKEQTEAIGKATEISNISNVSQGNITVEQHITINCPNVTDNSGIEYIHKELGNLTLKAYQYANQR